nr:MAG TPA: hypothetical protein [Caudoviricetes sp.]
MENAEIKNTPGKAGCVLICATRCNHKTPMYILHLVVLNVK